jgi:hypothetical protein
MTFSIRFMDVPPEYPYDDGTTRAARGLIVLGDWREEFLASLGDWTEAEYRQQWARSIQTLLEGNSKAVLIATFSRPTIASHLEWWALYREGENIFVQNQLLFYDQVEGEFDPKHAVEFLRERRTSNEEGLAISEWAVSMNDLRAFAELGY